MGATYVKQGAAIDYTPGSAVSAGDVVVISDLVAVAKLDIAANELGALAVEGEFDFTKNIGVGEAIAAGTKVYYDAAEDAVKADDETGANKYVGKVTVAAGDNDATVRVRLEQ